MQYCTTKSKNNLRFSFFDLSQTAKADYYCNTPTVDNFLFVNVPKCATQTVHAWSMQMATRDGVIDQPFSFTVLREPYGRLKSTFAYGVGAKYQYKFTVKDIGNWFMGKELPVSLTPNQTDLLTHFVPQHVFIDNAPIEIEHWYHTGQTRQLRRDLSHRSGINIVWMQENSSRYSTKFTIEYNKWFEENKAYIDNYLSADCELYRSRF